MNLLSILAALENSDDLHISRILILLGAFAGKDGSGKIKGLTKLAKLDFLLRYPVYLERSLQAKKLSTKNLRIFDHERMSVESSMVRYRYGPWDFRYRRFLNLMIAKGLVTIGIEGKAVTISLTSKGIELARAFLKEETFLDVVQRAKILKSHFNISATNLMRFVYDTFPEIGSLRLGEEIEK